MKALKSVHELIDVLSPYRQKALVAQIGELFRQDKQWGEQNHDPFTYLAILMEEVGELSQSALLSRFGGPTANTMEEEAVQVAAVGIAILECLYRGKWKWASDD